MMSSSSTRRACFVLCSSLLAINGLATPVLEARDAVPDGFVAADYYPTPHGGWADDWAEAYSKAVDLVSRMTLAEKTNITAGTGFFMGW
jgi:beta-glucosidase